MPKPDPIPIHPIPVDMSEVLRHEQANAGGLERYMNSLQRRYEPTVFQKDLRELAPYVEPVDRILGKDRNIPHSKAFYRGGLLGIHVVAACVGGARLDQVFEGYAMPLEVRRNPSDDNAHFRHKIGQHIMELGAVGYAAVDEQFESFFDEWDMQIEPDATKHRYVHCGFGFSIALLEDLRVQRAQEAEERATRQARKEMELALEQPDAIDWSQLLA